MCVSSFGRWLLASQACLPFRPLLSSLLAGCLSVSLPPPHLWVSPVSQDCLKEEGKSPQARCAGIDLKEVNLGLRGGGGWKGEWELEDNGTSLTGASLGF